MVDLPQPDSPGDAERLAGVQGQADPAHGGHVAAAGPVGDGQVAQLEQGHQRSRSLGSSTVSSAWPTMREGQHHHDDGHAGREQPQLVAGRCRRR